MRRLGSAARKKVDDLYSYSKMKQKLEDVLKAAQYR